MRNIVCYSGYNSDWHEALVNVIWLYKSEIEHSGLMLLLFFWMWHLGYLASSVTVVTSLHLHIRLLCGEGLWRQRCSSREEEGGTWELYRSNVLAKSTFFSKLQTAALRYFQIIVSEQFSHKSLEVGFPALNWHGLKSTSLAEVKKFHCSPRLPITQGHMIGLLCRNGFSTMPTSLKRWLKFPNVF